MGEVARYTDYDAFAWFYNRYWGGFSRQILPVLDRLILAGLAGGARILDLCCGTGHLARLLTERGFRVVGIDGSAEMLAFARQNAPDAHFLLADAREFSGVGPFDAAVSVYDSLNHVMSIEELAKVFRNVHGALLPGGRFVFDLNTEAAFRQRWNSSFGLAGDDHALVGRSSYDAAQREARMDLTMFRLVEGAWRRADVTLRQRAYSDQEVLDALAGAGFQEASALDGERDLQLPWGQGRTFFVAVREGPPGAARQASPAGGASR